MSETETTKPEIKVEPKTGFLEESAGVKSTTRLVTVIWALFAVGFSLTIYLKAGNVADALMAFGTIAAIASGNKLIQKPMENKINN